MLCPKCQFENPDKAKFCMECAASLIDIEQVSEQKTSQIEGERKQATILFSDLSGYTAITEKMDPEEVKNLMGDIFKKTGAIVEKYDGTVERFFGDEIMILFGVPKAHEDDPIRAIYTALEIHHLVDLISSEFEKQGFGMLKMHTGINTGLVITGDEYIGKGRHGLTGDTINIAKRFTNIAKPGQIIIGSDTHKLSENYFEFESMGPVVIKGKSNPISIFQVIDSKKTGSKKNRLKGVRADLIGRELELESFKNIVKDINRGKGSVICLYGSAGTGKSRLVATFKETMNIKWYEGYSYAYADNIPYLPLITLFNDIFDIHEDDSPVQIKLKIKTNIETLIEDCKSIIPYIGNLYSIDYPEIGEISPEVWKSNLHNAVFQIFSALSKEQQTIICLEDLHWADPSFLELITAIVCKMKLPILFILVSRPVIHVLSQIQIDQMKVSYTEMSISDLSRSDSMVMVRSLIRSDNIPAELVSFVENKTAGNPFYLEEMINSLLDSKVLDQENDEWVLTRRITDSDISSSIHGLISSRVDRLDREAKQIIQEASVIGRTFYYQIVRRITRVEKNIGKCLDILENLDLIKTKQNRLDLEYIFKHALTQEVVYKGLLKAERQRIHEKIGQVVETIFHDRLPEFYESLAHHYSKGNSVHKAIKYLVKSGEKSCLHYSLKESHQFFQMAFDLINSDSSKIENQNELMVDVLISWSFVLSYMGDFRKSTKLMQDKLHVAESLENETKRGMFYACLGWSLERRLKLNESYRYLSKAVEIARRTDDSELMGYANTWMIWTCGDMGLFKETRACIAAIQNKIQYLMKENHGFFPLCWCGIGWISWISGDSKGCFDAGKKLLKNAERFSDNRCETLGHIAMGWGHNAYGDNTAAIERFKKASEVALDPQFYADARFMMGFCYLDDDNIFEAGKILDELLSFNKKYGFEFLGESAKNFEGVIHLANGRIQKGLNLFKTTGKRYLQNGSKLRLGWQEHLLGKFYLKITLRSHRLGIKQVLKNIGSIIKTVPFAEKLAIKHLNKAIEIAQSINGGLVIGPAWLDLGYLHKSKNRKDEARKCLGKAISEFKRNDNQAFLDEAEQVLKSIE